MKADKMAHKHFPFLLYQTLLKVLSLALKYELSTEWTIVPGELSFELRGYIRIGSTCDMEILWKRKGYQRNKWSQLTQQIMDPHTPNDVDFTDESTSLR